MKKSTRSFLAIIGFAVLAGASAQQAQQQRPLPATHVRPGPAEVGRAPKMQVHEAAPSGARTFELRFSEGDDILSGVTELAQREKITAGYVTGIGGLAGATLGWGDPEVGGIKVIPVEQKCELVSLVGNISMRDGTPYLHAHGVVSLSDGSTRGGHLIATRVNPLAEVTVVATQFAK
jgi:predicted DNA-binding protein with PD1-like motif